MIKEKSRTRQCAEGLLILEKYRKNDNFGIGAEHDVIYAYQTSKPLSEEDFLQMIQLGWFQTDVENEEESFDKYDPEEGWYFFT
ncbi:MAG: hypothetical protein ACJAY9_000755 [Flavobacteriales bacterium]|jgi:hypothetical protein